MDYTMQSSFQNDLKTLRNKYIREKEVLREKIDTLEKEYLKKTEELTRLILQEEINTSVIEDESDRILNMQDAIAYLQLSRSYIYQLVWKKEIPFFKRGKKLYFHLRDLRKFKVSDYNMSAEEIAAEYIKNNPK